MKMHSPGQSSAASIAAAGGAGRHPGQAARAARVVERASRPRPRRRCRPRAARTRRGSGRRTGRRRCRGPGRSTPARRAGYRATMARAAESRRAEPPAPTGDRPQYAAGVLEPPVAKRVAHTLGPPDRPGRRSVGVAGRPRRSRHARLPRGRERLRRRLARRSTRRSSTPSSTRSRRRTQETDLSVPARKGPWWYATRTVEGLAYPIHCRGRDRRRRRRRRCSSTRTPRPAHDFFDARRLRRQPAATACSPGRADRNGHEELHAAHPRPRRGHRPARPARAHVLRHGVVGRRALPLLHPCPTTPCAPTRSGATSWARRRPTTCSSTRRPTSATTSTSSCAAAARTSSSPTRPTPRPTCWCSRPTSPLAEPPLVAERRPDVEYRLDHWGDRFVILTNLDAPDFKVVTAPVRQPGAGRVGRPRAPPGRAAASRRSSRSSTTSCCTSGPTRCERIRILRSDGSERTLAFDEPVHSVDHRRQPRVPHADRPLHATSRW